jgi:hypothetical protein
MDPQRLLDDVSVLVNDTDNDLVSTGTMGAVDTAKGYKTGLSRQYWQCIPPNTVTVDDLRLTLLLL